MLKAKMPCRTFEEQWKEIDDGLRRIFAGEKFTTKEVMELYTLVHNLCSSGSEPSMMTDERYDIPESGLREKHVGVYIKAEEHIHDFIKSKIKVVHDESDHEQKLRNYADLWKKFRISAKCANHALQYVNRRWVIECNKKTSTNLAELMPSSDLALMSSRKRNAQYPEQKIQEIYGLCMVLWKNEFFENPEVNVAKAALELIQQHRDGRASVQLELVKPLLESLIVCGVEFNESEDRTSITLQQNVSREEMQNYEKYFERPLMLATEKHYESKAATVRRSSDVMKLMETMDKCLKEETDRYNRFLPESAAYSKRRLQKLMANIFIEDSDKDFRSELRSFLDADELTNLNLLFRVCSPADHIMYQLRKDFKKYVIEKGIKAVGDIPDAHKKDPKAFVTTVLQIHKKYNDMIREAFGNDSGFSLNFDRACATYVNRNCIVNGSNVFDTSAQVLARFIDGFMRNPADGFEEMLDQVMTLFMYIEEKDVFQKYYNRFLSKRLIMERSGNNEHEKTMISALKTSCGHDYVGDSMKMFNDIEVSRTLTKKFCEESKPKIEVAFQVLSTGCWPFKEAIPFEIPPVFQDISNAFDAFYKGLHNGRKLTFLYRNSRGEISARFAKKYMFIATTPQMAVLLKYNDVTVSTVSQLLAELQMPEDVLLTVLASLVKADLLKVPEGVEVTTSLPNDTELSLNQKYSSKRYKVDLMKFQTPLKGDSETQKREQKDLEKTLEDSRKMIIQAAIVRIMKTRRCVRHNHLVSESITQVAGRFQPKIALVERCIDLLIEKDYLRQSPDNRYSYEYVA
ncbi:hypothetical protein QR680_015175 [Steinernema hermaphroditum]|uniref:Cullin family profile domain-containing protein n=1 Tax=Steinernema hermaphroditum TaxID=289476 RepID=A0AA39IBE2_9BILA|nr:hypothetical protein QR680_015175 [Steinernema hermaphroditum]